MKSEISNTEKSLDAKVLDANIKNAQLKIQLEFFLQCNAHLKRILVRFVHKHSVIIFFFFVN